MAKDSHTIPPTRKRHPPSPSPYPQPPAQEPPCRREREQRKQNLPLQFNNWGQGEDRGKGSVSRGRPLMVL